MYNWFATADITLNVYDFTWPAGQPIYTESKTGVPASSVGGLVEFRFATPVSVTPNLPYYIEIVTTTAVGISLDSGQFDFYPNGQIVERDGSQQPRSLELTTRVWSPPWWKR